MSLRDEIKQTKPFSSPAEEATLNIVRTAEVIRTMGAERLKPYGITITQYNVLRILRGAGAAGLPCGQIADRMVTQDSDITRLLDRLSSMGLIERGRSETDRRVVTTVLSADGRKLLTKLDPVVKQLNHDLLGQLDERTIAAMIRGLEQIRERAVTPA
ncbi:MAG TPA: MarR family transcriptional regulator [Gemmatimonadales bacterium]|nr:MarR family transcriptional regulator [Gemmatimonadales bacterium]